MALPQQVRKQAELAEQFDKRLLGAESDQESIEDNAPELEPVEDAPDDYEIVEEPKVEPQVKNDRENNPVYWRNRFNILAGKYNTEVPRYVTKVKDLEQRIDELSEQLKAQAVPENMNSQNYLTPEEEEGIHDEMGDEYGKKMIQAATIIADRIVQQKLSGTESKLNQIEKRFQEDDESQDLSNQQVFYEQLAVEHPDYLQIDESSEWIEWLDTVDSYSGQSRRDLLQQAEQVRDLKRVSRFFTDFKAMMAAQAKPEIPESKQALEETRNTSAVEKTSSDKPYFRRSQIKQFYDDFNRGKYRTNPDKARAIEQKISDALKEGRVIEG